MISITYNDNEISAQELGTFIRNILTSFLNKEPALYGLEYYYGNYYTDIVKGSYGYGLHDLIGTVSKSYVQQFNSYNSLIAVHDGMIYFSTTQMKIYTPEEFEQDLFALSTVLNSSDLFFSDVLSYSHELELKDCGLLIDAVKIVKFYDFYRINQVQST